MYFTDRFPKTLPNPANCGKVEGLCFKHYAFVLIYDLKMTSVKGAKREIGELR